MWQFLKKQFQEWRGVLIAAPSVGLIIILLRFLGGLQTLELEALDQFFRLRPSQSCYPNLQSCLDSPIVIVGINEKDIAKLRQWPIPDYLLAQLLTKIKQQHPRGIGLDLYRDFPVQPGYEDLVKIFKNTPNLIGIEKVIGDERTSPIPAPPILRELGQVGSNDLIVDGDGKVRRMVLSVQKPDGTDLPSFGFLLALIYLEKDNIFPEADPNNPDYFKLNNTLVKKLNSNDGGYVNADERGYPILLNYKGKSGSFPTVSMTDILENKIPPDLFKDRLVFIGATATSSNDFVYTPYSKVSLNTVERTPGVEIQANLSYQLIKAALEDRPLIQTWSETIEIIWIFGWSILGAIFTWKLRDTKGVNQLFSYWTIIALILSLGGLFGLSYWLFLAGWWIPLIPPAFALFGSVIAQTIYIGNLEHQDRQMIMNLFSRHVSPKVAEAIWHERADFLKQGQLKGKKSVATVFFSDLKGFSTISEQLDPELLIDWLNQYMEVMSELVLEHGGIVDKYIGDAIMAIFGVPIPTTISQDAIAAVNCALEMGEKLETLNQQWQSQNLPTVAIRIGIATGLVVTGSLGGSKRCEYTALGDTVNIASRLESYGKDMTFKTYRILVNETAYEFIKDHFEVEFVGTDTLKGRQQESKIYRVLKVKNN